MPDHLTVGLLGLGVVGSGVVRLLREHETELAARAGVVLRVGPVAVRDPARPRDVDGLTLSGDARSVVDDPDVDIVVEVMGGLDPTRDLVEHALRSGTSVVTANKTLIADAGHELATLAAATGARLEYEAAVAGAVPIIRPLRESLAGDRVHRVLGILNGTTNYVLTRMQDEGLAFDEAVAQAQRLGYAEADPTADVAGHDAAQKAAILASIAFDRRLTASDVHVEGITRITAADMDHASRLGYRIKLLATAERQGDAVGVRVHPALVPVAHPMAAVRDAYNAVFVQAEAAGDLMFYGRGAGSLPTASAVVGNLVTVARSLRANRPTPQPLASAEQRPLLPYRDMHVQAFVLLDVVDASGVLARIAEAFGHGDVSIERVWQEGRGDVAQLILVTHTTTEGALAETVDRLRRLEVVRDVASVLRVLGDSTSGPPTLAGP